jgi:hypothetical protein
MDHVRPDLQSYCDIGRSSLRHKSSGIIEQGLVRTSLN